MSSPISSFEANNDFNTTHWASPTRKISKSTHPSNLAEEIVFSVGDKIEFRVFGRHGWHEAKVVNTEMLKDGAMLGFVYDVESASPGSNPSVVTKGLRAGNLRKLNKQSKKQPRGFSLAMSRPPVVEDFVPTPTSADFDSCARSDPSAPTKQIGTSKISGKLTVQPHTQFEFKYSDKVHIPKPSSSPKQQHSRDNQPTYSSPKISSTEEIVKTGSEESESTSSDIVKTISARSISQLGEDESSHFPNPIANLLRYGTTRGINATTWFAPTEGWGDPAQPKLITGSVFVEKLTYLGLGLAVGRPFKEQLFIEEALSTHHLEQAVKVATAATMQEGTINASFSKNTTSFIDASRECLDIDWLVKTCRLEDETSSTASPSSKGADRLKELEGMTEAVNTLQQEGKRPKSSSWRSRENKTEKRLKTMIRFHGDRFYKLRSHLGLLDSRFTKSQFQQDSEAFSDPGRVGAAAAAVFNSSRSVHNMDQSTNTIDSTSHISGVSGVENIGMSEASFEPMQLELAPKTTTDEATVQDVLTALNGVEFNRWRKQEAEAILRMAKQLTEEEQTPISVDRATLKEYLMGLKLVNQVDRAAWTLSKDSKKSVFKTHLIQNFKAFLVGSDEVLRAGVDIQSSTTKEKFVELISKLEQSPESLDIFQGKSYSELLQAEAQSIAQEFLETNDARREIRDRMVKEIERRRLAGGSNEEGAVSLFALYQKHVNRWYKLKQLNGSMTEKGAGGGDEEEGDSYSMDKSASYHNASSSHVSSNQPHSFNEWLDKYGDPTGEVKKFSLEQALADKVSQLIQSEEAPLIELSVDEAPRSWKGLGEVARRDLKDDNEKTTRKVVLFRPLLLTKQLLKDFVMDEPDATESGFLDWLNARTKHREETKARVGEWVERKSKVKALIKAKASCCAVLCMDAGGMESTGAGHTIDEVVKTMVPFTECAEGGDSQQGSGVGSFNVRKPSRKGLNIASRLRKVAEKSVEVPPRPPNQAATQLRLTLKQLMKTHVASKRKVHVDKMKIPAMTPPLVLGDVRNSSNITSSLKSSTSHATKIYHYLYRQSARRPCDLPSTNDGIVEVKVKTNGKWHKALVLTPSEVQTKPEPDENTHEETSKCKRKSSIHKPIPRYYEVQLTKSAREGLLEEEVDTILQKCSAQGIRCNEEVDESGRVRVQCEPVDAESGLRGQHIILEELSARLGLEELSLLKDIPWVGPLALPGTAQMPPRRTHAFVVSKGALDEELESCLESMLADPAANPNAKKLIDTFDYGLHRKSSNQGKLKVVTGVTSAAQATLQQRLVETTDGLFQVEEERQIELAQELAESRDKEADRAFREWSRAKVLAKRKEISQIKKTEKEKEAQERGKHKACKKAYKTWTAARAKKKYVSGSSELKVWPPVTKKIVQKPWSFAPPTAEEELLIHC